MTEIMDNNRLKEQRAKRNMTQSKLAEASGINPATIIKIEKGVQDMKLDSHVRPLARALGIRPVDLMPADLLDDAIIKDELMEPEAVEWKTPANQNKVGQNYRSIVDFMLDGDPDKSAWVNNSSALDLEGYRIGDIFILDATAKPQPGDIVCAQIYSRDGAETVFRQYMPPYLLSISSRPEYRTPYHIESRDVRLAGTVIHTLRSAQKMIA